MATLPNALELWLCDHLHQPPSQMTVTAGIPKRKMMKITGMPLDCYPKLLGTYNIVVLLLFEK